MRRFGILVAGLAVSVSAYAAEHTPAERGEICRAAIGGVMGRKPSIMKAQAEGEVSVITYNRPSDGKLWSYRCRLEGNRVIWATETGRWRTDPLDSVVTFEVLDKGKRVRIVERHEDGSQNEYSYHRSELR
ncbi:hypothetical protein [Microvirga lotononidis]|uniref:Uncharacterized protein n=2 Tax=Microvirga lotononidis TaxID=864069 RepID=I4YQE0_9HYPH|nr:hypothetical protein [Microvirga lotononidis]EIM26182.1 hypothetical protein MicloDRAFT_00051400 [Microvirga lotononidis]WQO31488.1 hypothetical protein U0023_35000 [Microvirga lotononidis]